MDNESKLAGLKRLREPFPANLISQLPKPTKAQTEAVKADYKTGIRCQKCGTWHHKDVVHLDYVGHAALTDRLLDADPEWNWEPVAVNPDGSPVLDKDGGMWIRLTVCGVTRLGYGDAGGKTGADAMKERVGDALRNSGMRFGAALDLWSKVDLHFDEHDDAPKQIAPTQPGDTPPPAPQKAPPATWPDDKLSAALAKHGPAVTSGTKTADALLTWLTAKAPLTADQETKVRALAPAAGELMATAKEISALRQQADDLGVSAQEVCDRFGFASLNDVPAAKVEAVRAFISNGDMA